MTAEVIATTIDIESTERNIGKLQSQINEHAHAIQNAVWALEKEAKPLTDDEFWAFMPKLINSITRLGDKISMASVQQGTQNFIHSLTYNHIRGMETNRETAMRFVVTYKSIKNRLYESLYKVTTDLSDDGYGDFVDSFPLNGREITEAALDGRLINPQDELELGENYVASRLEDAMIDLYSNSCAHDYDPEGKGPASYTY